MRDPDLVQRAERAANALERAWDRWRATHGFGPEPSPPVSSYVGYSLEEPWGQPRVVFGVGAEEAERLAALLDGHDCVGPVYAELASNPDWRRAPVSDAASQAWSVGDRLSIPSQARPPAADMLAPIRPTDGPTELDGRPIKPGANDPRVIDPSVIDPSVIDGASPAEVARRGAAPSDLRDEDVPSGAASDEPQSAGRAEPAGSLAAVVPPELIPQELVPLPPLPDQPLTGPTDAAYLAAAPVPDVKRAHGPGYRGPRYRGSPPQYSPANDSAAKGRPARVRDAQDSAAQDSAAKDGAAQVSDAQDGAAQVSDAQDGAAQVGAAQVRAAKDSAARVRAAKSSAAKEHAAHGSAAAHPDQPPSADYEADPGASDDASAGASTPERAKSRQAPKLNRTRRQGPDTHEVGDSTGEQPAADPVV
jgi:hypothetical protein